MSTTSYLTAGATAPSAGAAVGTTGNLAAGTYGVTVTTILTGTTVLATDLNNFQLQVGATVIGPLATIIPTATGNWTNPQFEVVVPAATAVTVNAIAAGSAAAKYQALIVLNE